MKEQNKAKQDNSEELVQSLPVGNPQAACDGRTDFIHYRNMEHQK